MGHIWPSSNLSKGVFIYIRTNGPLILLWRHKWYVLGVVMPHTLSMVGYWTNSFVSRGNIKRP